MRRASFRAAAGCFVCVAGLLLAGCGQRAEFEFDYLDVAPVEEDLAEVPLGEYHIPVPVPSTRGRQQPAHRNRLQLDFRLVALVPPADEPLFSDAWQRHEGQIRDRVIAICRNASAEELLEPELATLKARLTDALAGQVGEKGMRQLLITDLVSQPL
jgi:hypothetical protein